MRLDLKRLSGVVWVSQRFGLAYPKVELEDLGLSGLQVVPTTFQPLQGQPVRRMGYHSLPLNWASGLSPQAPGLIGGHGLVLVA